MRRVWPHERAREAAVGRLVGAHARAAGWGAGYGRAREGGGEEESDEPHSESDSFCLAEAVSYFEENYVTAHSSAV